jgi:hypothetical protein
MEIPGSSEIDMRILFCSDPLNIGQVDPSYADEAAAAAGADFPIARVDYEALVDERDARRAVRKVEAGEDVGIYRGWMLRPEPYRELYDALAGKGVRLINTPEEYLHCHHLPESYGVIESLTPKTVWMPADTELDRAMEALRPFGDVPMVLKDYVKSRKHEWAEACFIPRASDREAVGRVVRRFRELQGDTLAGGLVFREFVEFESAGRHPKSGMPLAREQRMFWLGGRPLLSFPYWSDLGQTGVGPPPGTFDMVAAKIRSHLFTMDVAKRKDGAWMIVELGDGQVAGLPDDAAATAFYAALRRVDA